MRKSAATLPQSLLSKLHEAGEKSKEWPVRRDKLIVEASKRGAGPREIARAVGLSHPSIIHILDRDTAS